MEKKASAAAARPSRLHGARHTFASLALASGKSVRSVASQLGRADPALTHRVHAQTLR
jgi:integrase